VPLSYILIALLLVLLILGLPSWPYAAGWGVGYGPSSLLGVVLVVVIVLMLMGRF
jgi:hypothetical protein